MRRMESEDDAEQMLKAVFDSCDSVGLGLLAPEDFEILCKKLMIQDCCKVLSRELFPESNVRKLLSFERFRDTLLMFLKRDAPIIDENVSTDTNRANTDSLYDSDAEKMYYPMEEQTESANIFNGSYLDGDIVDDDDIGENGTLNSPRRTSSFKKRYGRTSKPDADLLGGAFGEDTNESAMALRELAVTDGSNTDGLSDENVRNLPWKFDENGNEKENSPIAMKEEEFSGNGDEENWKNPDSEWMTSMNTSTEDIEPSSKDSSMIAVKTKLETAWFRVVGDPAVDGIDETKLKFLCAELGLNNLTQPEDISELFDALDGDCDGLVMFDEFSELMSAFIGCPPAEEHYEANISRDNDASDVSGVDRFDSSFDQQDDQIDSHRDAPGTMPTPMHSSPFYENNSVHPPSCKVIAASPDTSNVLAASNERNSSVEVSDEPSSPSGRLSLDNDTSLLCPPVVSVEPRQLAAINRGRRRRRSSAVAASNPANARHQRKKSSRSIPLPHYHPASIRKREELPLSYLAEENGRYVSRDELCQYWEADGIENSSEVFDALQLSSSEQSISIEALSEVLEMEFEQNLIEKAALVLYKRGIMHYRSLNCYGEAERTKLANKINLLTSQLQEQEERFEKAESKFAQMLREKESRYKNEIRALTNEITESQNRLKEFEDSSLEDRHSEIELLNQKFEEASRTCEEMKRESERLTRLLQKTETQLKEAEEDKIAMLDEIDATRSELAVSNELLVSQRARNSQILDLWKLNEEGFQSMQDRHDELLSRLYSTGRRRTSPTLLKSPPRRRSGSPDYFSGSSTYTTASEGPIQSSPDSQLEPSNDALLGSATEKDQLTSSPDEGARPSNTHSNSQRILLSNEFAFLTPSSTRSVSRLNQTYSTVNSPTGSPILNDSFVNL